jgi:CDP-L-myo-inositol myo-inositolphosphotransferase
VLKFYYIQSKPIFGELRVKVLILAAGRGERLDSWTASRPKPLIPILGETILARTLLTLKTMGFREFVLVVGYLGKMIKNELGTGEKYGISIEYVDNPEWERGNAISVLTAEKHLGEEFLLVMGDHLIESSMVKELLKHPSDLTLCVDSDPQNTDLEEATKIYHKDRHLIRIGKELDQYNTVDTGLFVCRKKIFPSLKRSIEEGREEWSDHVQRFAEENHVETVDTPGSCWMDIDTDDDLRTAEVALLESLTKPTDGIVSRHINRRVSRKISSLLSRTEISPNQISFTAFILGLLSGLLFAQGSWFSAVLGGVLAQSTSIVDGCDGEIARLRFKATSYGAWFDAVLDRYADAFITLGMTYGVWSTTGNPWTLLIGSIALIGSYSISYSADRYEGAFREKYHETGFKIPMSRDVRLIIIMLGGLLNLILPTLLILAILTNIEVSRRLLTRQPE